MKVNRILEGLRMLGVPVERHQNPHPGAFLPGVWIDRGVLCVCPWASWPGDVLHEAGHLAVVPARFRPVIQPGPIDRMSGPLARAVLDWILTDELFHIVKANPDDPRILGLLHMGDQEASAWAYAAAVAIGFPTRAAFVYRYPDVPEMGQPYQGGGKEVWEDLRRRDHPGIEGLHAAGLCEGARWPAMTKWMQD